MYRFIIFQELEITPLPCLVREATDEEVLALQIQANAIRPTTKQCDFARQLRQILDANPGMAYARLQGLIHKHPHWIGQQLGLLKLVHPIQKAVDRGEIPLSSAYVLSNVLRSEQHRFVDLAKTADVRAFRAAVAPFIKQQREAVRQGKLDLVFANEFQPVAHLRCLGEVREERETLKVGPLLLAAEDARSPLDGWKACLDWVLPLGYCRPREQLAKHTQRMQKTFTADSAVSD